MYVTSPDPHGGELVHHEVHFNMKQPRNKVYMHVVEANCIWHIQHLHELPAGQHSRRRMVEPESSLQVIKLTLVQPATLHRQMGHAFRQRLASVLQELCFIETSVMHKGPVHVLGRIALLHNIPTQTAWYFTGCAFIIHHVLQGAFVREQTAHCRAQDGRSVQESELHAPAEASSLGIETEHGFFAQLPHAVFQLLYGIAADGSQQEPRALMTKRVAAHLLEGEVKRL